MRCEQIAAFYLLLLSLYMYKARKPFNAHGRFSFKCLKSFVDATHTYVNILLLSLPYNLTFEKIVSFFFSLSLSIVQKRQANARCHTSAIKTAIKQWAKKCVKCTMCRKMIDRERKSDERNEWVQMQQNVLNNCQLVHTRVLSFFCARLHNTHHTHNVYCILVEHQLQI